MKKEQMARRFLGVMTSEKSLKSRPLMVCHGNNAAAPGKERYLRKSIDFSTLDNVGSNWKKGVGELPLKNGFPPHVPVNLQMSTESIASTSSSSSSSQYFYPKLATTTTATTGSRKLGQFSKGPMPVSLPEIPKVPGPEASQEEKPLEIAEARTSVSLPQALPDSAFYFAGILCR